MAVGVVLVNPESGPGDHVAELRDLFSHQEFLVVSEPDRVASAVRSAIDRGAAFVGVAGGDGTIRGVAEQLVDTSVPLLVIPAGTRNHFAKDLGIEDFSAAAAAVHGVVTEVDVGCVNGKYFVNNSSIGVYPKIVVRREAHQTRLPKRIASVVAAWEQLRHGRRVKVEIEGVPLMAWMVFVGNGPYGDGILDLADRESLSKHILDLRIVRADRPLARLRVIAALALGRLARSPLIEQRECQSVEVNVRDRKSVEVALDGEVEELELPLRYESLPGALKVLTQASSQDGASARR
jgi:undecaprenyl-diphosphatase